MDLGLEWIEGMDKKQKLRYGRECFKYVYTGTVTNKKNEK